MSSWRHLSEALPSVGNGAPPATGVDLSEENVNDLWKIAAVHLPDEPDRQAKAVTYAIRLQLGPAAFAARARRVRSESQPG